MPAPANLFSALSVNLLLLGLYAGLPALCHLLCCGRRPNGETFWLASGGLIAFQALFGTLLSRVFPAFTPAWNALLLLPFALLASRIASRIAAREPCQKNAADPWLIPLLLLAFSVRILSPLRHMALGQSDAYSHLQFLRDMVTTGQLRHSFYPPGHARVSAPALWISTLDLYTFARYAGAAYGIGLVFGVYHLTRRICSQTAARFATLLAAAFPAFAPLLRTGVGLYANQLGLLLIPFLLWTLSLLTRDNAPRKLYAFLVLFAAALMISVPMMLLDLLPLLALLLLPRVRLRILIPATLLLLAAGLFLLSRIPLEPLQQTANIFTRQEQSHPHSAGILLQLLKDYLHWKTPSVSALQRIGIGAAALLAAATALRLPKRLPAIRPILMFTAISGLQTATGLLQFSSYQRAGWFFLIGLCLLGGILADEIIQRAPRLRWTSVPLTLLCLLSLWFPPYPAPHLSPGEEDLIRTLVTLRSEYQTCETRPAIRLWVRAFTRFDGAQGDPVPALLEDRPCIRIRRILPDTPLPIPGGGHHVFLIDSGEITYTADPIFNREREKLLLINDRILAQIQELGRHPQVRLTSRNLSPNLTLWEAEFSKPDY